MQHTLVVPSVVSCCFFVNVWNMEGEEHRLICHRELLDLSCNQLQDCSFIRLDFWKHMGLWYLAYRVHLTSWWTWLAGILLGIAVLKNIDVKPWEQILWWISITGYVLCMVAAIVWNVVFPRYPQTDWRACCPPPPWSQMVSQKGMAWPWAWCLARVWAAYVTQTNCWCTCDVTLTRQCFDFLLCQAKHWPSSYCLTPNDHQVACIFLVLIQPIRRALSKWPFHCWFCLLPAADVCEGIIDYDSTEKWLKEIPRMLTGKVLKLQW